MKPVYEYKGYRYEPTEDREPDNIKIFHDVVTPDGKTIHLDYSPYTTPSEDCFKKWVDLGCPKKKMFTPNWDDKDILKLWSEHECKKALYDIVHDKNKGYKS